MVQQILSPGVEDGEEAEARTKVARTGRDLQQRLAGSAKKQSIEHALIL